MEARPELSPRKVTVPVVYFSRSEVPSLARLALTVPRKRSIKPPRTKTVPVPSTWPSYPMLRWPRSNRGVSILNALRFRRPPPTELSPRRMKSREPVLSGPKTSLESRLMTPPVRA